MMKSFQKSLNWISIGYLIVGIALIVWPQTLLQTACYIIGAIVLIAGLSSIFSYLKIKDEIFSARVTLVIGVVVSGLGLFLLLQPKTVASILPVIVGLFVLFDGISRLQTAWRLKQASYEKWWGMAIPSLISAGLGGLILFNPFGTAALMVQMIGLILTFEGIINLSTGLFARNIFKKMENAEQEMEEVFEEFVPDAEHIIETNHKTIDADFREL